MAHHHKRAARSQRLTYAKFTPPDWYGWLAVIAMLLLPVVRVGVGDGEFRFPLLSLGEWLMLPLGAASVSMGLLSLARLRERTLLPLWLSAIVPGALWLAAAGMGLLRSGAGQDGGDLFLSWAVHLLFPTLAFLPLLPIRAWRNRLLWALAGAVAANAVCVFLQSRIAGLPMPDPGLLLSGGLLDDQFDYGLMLAMALPLLAAWRGGGGEKNRALYTMIFTFLLPLLALSACYTWAGMAAAALAVAIAWAAWRSPAWVMGAFICILVFGYGSGERGAHERDQRRLLTASTHMGEQAYANAFRAFENHPYTGEGLERFVADHAARPGGAPWYASLLGGTGLVGLGMWVVMLAELAARCIGRSSRRCLYAGGVLGAVAGLTVAGLWTDVLAEGVGGMVGVLTAFSIIEEPERPVVRIRPKRRLEPSRPAMPIADGKDDETR